MKKRILALLLLLLCYLLVGSIAPYTNQPSPSAQTQDSFQASDCYGVSTGSDRAAIIDDNQAALELRLQMIAHAQEQLILSTFDFRSDQAGTDLLAALLDAGERGVQVRLLVDGFSAFLRMERNPLFYALSSHPNIEIRVYNPIQLWKPWNLMGRLHDKYLIADHTAYLLGGRNCFNSFLGSYGGGQNRDRDVLVYNAGNVSDSSLYQVEDYYRSISALDCCKLFHDDEDLAARSSVQEAQETLHQRLAELKALYPACYAAPCDYRTATLPTRKITLLSNPTQVAVKEPVLFYELMELCKSAKKQVILHTPYVIANDWMTKQLGKIGSKGQILLNSAATNGNPFASSDYVRHKQELVDTGLEIHEYIGKISYHGKSIAIDDRLAIVGSFNMDMRSTYLDTELMLVIDSPEVTQALKASMDALDAQAAVVADAEHYLSLPNGMAEPSLSTGKQVVQFFTGWALELGRFLL